MTNPVLALPAAVKERRLTLTVACVSGVLVIAEADYLTGYEFALALFYLLPVGAAAWMGGRTLGWVIVVLSTVAWLLTDLLAGHVYAHPLYRYWEAVIHLVTYGTATEILLRLKLALARSDERFIVALEAMDAAICAADSGSGQLLFANGRFRSLFGKALRGETIASLWDLFGFPAVSAVDSGPAGLEGSHAGRVYLIRLRSLRWTTGRQVIFVTLTDITAHKQAEQASRWQQDQMQRTSKLVAVGEMASMLAHEMNQPLGAIVNYSRGCIRRLRAGDVDRQELLEIMQQSSLQAERAAKILQRAREYVRKREPLRESLDLKSLVTQAALLVRDDMARAGVTLSLEAPERLPSVPGDRSMIEQVLVNLMRNGVDAMSESMPGKRSMHIVLTASNDAITVAVQDSGCGIPEEIRSDLFKPFFSTKSDGMGLGLSICRSIVEYHRGQLRACANPGGGSTFQFTLPLNVLP